MTRNASLKRHRRLASGFLFAAFFLPGAVPAGAIDKIPEDAWVMPKPPPVGAPPMQSAPPVEPPSILLEPNNYPDVRVRPTTNSTQSEMSIAVSPLSNSVVLASANASNYPYTAFYGTGYYVSTDGGATWGGNDQPPPGNGNSGDPAAAIDRLGYFYIGSIATNSGQGVMRSTNGGVAWTYFQVANPTTALLDKNHLTVDNHLLSPRRDNLYSAWSDFAFADRSITTARSTDHGVTWGAKQIISSGFTSLSHQGVNVQTGPDGSAYACWAVRDAVSPFTERGVGFNRSTDGGATWGAAGYAINGIRGIRQNPYPVLGIRTNSFPVMGVDQHSGWIYIAWVNVGVPGVNTGDPDLYLIRSTDAGASWSSPVRVNQDAIGNGALQFHCWLGVDPLASGSVYVSLYDNRAHIGTNTCEFYVSRSTDAGATWDDYAASDAPFTVAPVPGFGTYNGEYPGMAVRCGRSYPLWHSPVPGANPQGWTSPTIAADLLLANTTIQAGEVADYEVTTAITAGPAYEVKSGSTTTFEVVAPGTGSIVLKDGFLARAGCVFRAFISTTSQRLDLAVMDEVEGAGAFRAGGGVEAIHGAGSAPRAVALEPIRPNPCRDATTVRFALPSASPVTLTVYDVAGRLVERLVEGSRDAGWHDVAVRSDHWGSGVYFVRLESPSVNLQRKVVVLK